MGRQYFGTDGIRGKVGHKPITPDFMLQLGWAAGCVLRQNVAHPSVIIGKDTRISGYMFESALEAGFSAAGVNITLVGPMPTPAVAYLTRTFRADFGIMITASHNPHTDNGIKFFSKDGFKISNEIEEAIESMLESPLSCVESGALGKAVRMSDAPGRYIEFCKSTFPSSFSLQGMKIVVDCANGATYHIASNVFKELGAEVVQVGVDPNGVNINQDCGSTSPEMLSRLVLSENADIGVAFDGDGDRLIAVDHMGQLVDGDGCLYVIAKHCAQLGVLEGGVVGTLMTNLGLEKAIKALGVDFYRANVGDRYVMEALRDRQWSLGGEQSGHVICLDHTTTGDGIVSSLQLLAAMVHAKKSLKVLASGLVRYPQQLTNIRLQTRCDVTENKAVQNAVEIANKTLGNNGRLLLRLSGTEPVVRVMVEAEDQALVDEVSQQLVSAIKKSYCE